MKNKKIGKVRYLLHGGESPKRFYLMLGLTSIRSEPIIAALVDYYVKGHTQAVCLSLNGIKRDKFDRADRILNATASDVEEIKAMDFHTRIKKPRKKRVDPLSDVDLALPE